MKNNIEQIDKDEFEAAIKELNIGNHRIADEFLLKVTTEKNSSKLNLVRAGYISAYKAAQRGDYKSMARHAFTALTLSIDLRKNHE